MSVYSKNSIQGSEDAFTLVELLVVLAILGILATIGLVAFGTAQMRSRDAQRKSDLKQVANAVEMYYNDYGDYPDSSGGYILGCPSTTGSQCTWGSWNLAFTDEKTTYLKEIPGDPGAFNYYYRKVDLVGGNGFQIYAELENLQDSSACIAGDCSNPPALPAGVECGGKPGCNFAVTSPNVAPTDEGIVKTP